MYCNECGQQIPDDSKACMFCGAVVNNNAAPVPVNDISATPVTPAAP